jgi:hypothetical protein
VKASAIRPVAIVSPGSGDWNNTAATIQAPPVWFSSSGKVGCCVFESEDVARSAAAQAQAPGDFVTFDSVEVGEVVAIA